MEIENSPNQARASEIGPPGPTSLDDGFDGDFNAFYRAQFASIATVAGTTTGERSSGEDIAQEAFQKAHDDWPRVSQLDKPGAWVRRVAINLALSRRRRRGIELNALTRLGSSRHGPTRPPGDRRHPEVWDAVAKLPPRQRAVIALHYHEGHSVAQIADLLDCSVSAATSNLHKARTRLADLLGDER